MSDLNNYSATGRIGNDPELRHAGGEAVTNVRLAVSRKWRDKASQEMRERTLWLGVSIWGRQAEVVAEHCRKGERLGVTGELEMRSYTDKQGMEREVIELRARDVVLLGGGAGGDAQRPAQATGSEYRQASGGGRKPAPPVAAGPDPQDDIPF